MSSNVIRDYIYLDVDRARSLYSQLKGGLLESYIKGEETNESSSNTIGNQRETVEQRALLSSTHEATHVLHDFMLTEIETQMKESVKEVSTCDIVDSLTTGDYVRVCGRAQMNDTKRLISVLNDFNSLHSYISMAGQLEDMQKGIWDLEHKIDFETLRKTDLDKLSRQLASMKPPAIFRKEHKGVPDLTREMMTLWFGLLYSGVYEINIIPSFTTDVVFRSVIDESYLRENPSLLYAKHSTRTQAIWTLVGQVTAVHSPQSLGEDVEDEEEDYKENAESTRNMRDQFESIFDSFIPMEEHLLVSAVKTSIVLTPLAIFQETKIREEK
ncbi:MAG: hypothetical protein OXE52_11050 [Chloroflexi bacterium]|nr:hypothetical protein [Chloroflexota bacterium]